MIQLLLFPLPPAPLQLALELAASFEVPNPVSRFIPTTKGPTMTTTPARRRGPLRRFLDRLTRPPRFGTPSRPFPSSTADLTPDDWRVIRIALQRAIVEHTAGDRWPAAEAAQRALDKTGTIA